MSRHSDVELNVNGRMHRVAVEPRKTLADTIRDDCGLTGTHLGCEHGVCGACTVLVDDEPIRSCLMFAVQAADRTIRTVEGLADGERLHAVQQAFVSEHALQCGFCTPGFLMLIVGTLEKYPDIDDAMLREFVGSNLCRCTGYENIVTAAQNAAAAMRSAS